MPEQRTDKETKATPEGSLATIEYVNQRGVELHTMDDLWRFANMVLASHCVPKGYDSVASIVVAIQYGAELGLSPMTSLQRIAVINGRPTVYGDVMLGLCRRASIWDETGFKEYIDCDGARAICECRRRGGNTCTRSFSVEDAKRAKLWGKTGPWTDYPQRMLQMRARAFALRDTFPDVLQGLYSTEELQGSKDYAAIIDAAPVPDSAQTGPTEEEIEAKLRKPESKVKVGPAPGDAPDQLSADILNDAPAASARDLDTLRRKVLGIWANLAPDKRAYVAKSVDGLDQLNLMASFETLRSTREIGLLTAVLETIPGA